MAKKPSVPFSAALATEMGKMKPAKNGFPGKGAKANSQGSPFQPKSNSPFPSKIMGISMGKKVKGKKPC